MAVVHNVDHMYTLHRLSESAHATIEMRSEMSMP